MSLTVDSTTQVTFSPTDAARAPQIAFALLQMELAKANKEAAMNGIDEIKKQQAEKKECAEMLNTAREFQSQGICGGSKEDYDHMKDVAIEYRNKKWASLPDIDDNLKKLVNMQGPPYGSLDAAVKKWNEIIPKLEAMGEQAGKLYDYCAAQNISLPTSTDKDTNKTQWDKVIAQLQTTMDTKGADIQTKMVQLQDMMGQYNSYVQGANSAISTSNQTLSSLARGQ